MLEKYKCNSKRQAIDEILWNVSDKGILSEIYQITPTNQ